LSLEVSVPRSAPNCTDLGVDIEEIRESLSKNIGFPTRHYHDPGIYELELARIFESRWQYFVPLALVSQPGDVVTGMVGRTPIVVTRDQSGQLHAMVNVCRHRGFRVVGSDEKGCKRLYCRYHAWTYRLDGTLMRAPNTENDSDFAVSDHGLRKISVGTWGPAVFVNTDPEAPSLNEAMPELWELSARLGFDEGYEGYVLHDTYTKQQAANWKLWTDNGVECYHCGPVHGESFNKAFAVDVVEGRQSPVIQMGPLLSSVFHPQKERVADLQTTFYRSILFFPGAHIIQQDDLMIMGRMVPTGPESCTYTAHYMRPKSADPEMASAWVGLYNKTFDEDAEVVELQQINLRSPKALPFRYIPSREETSILTNRMIADAIAD
jgi:phenylpropionate dioxygenase-like ring-hydroxylating dioxygenase large terminal subunit